MRITSSTSEGVNGAAGYGVPEIVGDDVLAGDARTVMAAVVMTLKPSMLLALICTWIWSPMSSLVGV
jgi:hypothetical protein